MTRNSKGPAYLLPQANALLSKLSSFASARGYSFERPKRDEIGAEYGFVMSTAGFKAYGALYNTTMRDQIYLEIKPKFYELCESANRSCFVIVNDLVKNQFVVIPYALLQPCLNPKALGVRKLWQFAMQRDLSTFSKTNYHLLRYRGGTIAIPETCVGSFEILLQPWNVQGYSHNYAQSSAQASWAPSLVQTNVPSRKSIDYEDPPACVAVETVRRIRDTAKTRQLKALYSNHCQVCQARLRLGPNEFLSEVHHLRPLGGGANGLDNKDNMLVLCPNHHARFDYLAIGIDPSDGITVVDFEGTVIGKLTFVPGHSLNPSNIRFHFEQMTKAFKT